MLVLVINYVGPCVDAGLPSWPHHTHTSPSHTSPSHTSTDHITNPPAPGHTSHSSPRHTSPSSLASNHISPSHTPRHMSPDHTPRHTCPTTCLDDPDHISGHTHSYSEPPTSLPHNHISDSSYTYHPLSLPLIDHITSHIPPPPPPPPSHNNTIPTQPGHISNHTKTTTLDSYHTTNTNNHIPSHIHNTEENDRSSLPSHAHNHNNNNSSSNQRKNSDTVTRPNPISSHTTSPTHIPNYRVKRKVYKHSHTSSHTQDKSRRGEGVEEDVAAAVTGGVSYEGRLVVEVFKSSHPDLPTALALCCHHSHAPTTTQPRLLLLTPAEAFNTTSQLIHVLKDQAWVEVKVWAVAKNTGAAGRARETLASSALQQVEVLSVGELQRRVSKDQLTSQFGGSLHFDPKAWRTLSQLREDIIGTLRPIVSRLEGWLATTSSSCTPVSDSPLSSSTSTSSTPLSTTPSSSTSQPSSTTNTTNNYPLAHSTVSTSTSSQQFSTNTTSISSSTSSTSSSTSSTSNWSSSVPCVEEVRRSVTRAKTNLWDMETCCQRFRNNTIVKWWMVECQELVETVEAVLRLVEARTHTHLHSPRSRLTHRANMVVHLAAPGSVGTSRQSVPRHYSVNTTTTTTHQINNQVNTGILPSPSGSLVGYLGVILGTLFTISGLLENNSYRFN
ncbi:hypothetical protein Pmani_031886 [Petrolisthes manimaculis]|uniref:Uncharacterized protein n=1 Tax=Petrolisthes manimaculis TaxID=1843537 RepID=A0AAE1TRY6_9EUCA|nr:hypothetical protein Pmani_031886 [Petrolisthes manimaculis]